MSGWDGEPDLELAFPPKAEYVAMARHAVAAVARMHGLADGVVEDAKLAVSEACTNAVTSTGAASADEPIRVSARAGGGYLEIDVQDGGEVPSASRSESPREFDSQEFSFETNLSLPLILGLVDDLEIVAPEGGGRLVRMRLPLDAAEGS
jgi:serine/threonine-protein kinase RsbW